MKTNVVVACALILGSAVASRAAVITVRPKLVAVFNADFSPVDPSSIVSIDANHAALNPIAGKYIAQIDVVMTISDLQGSELGFGNAAFNVHLRPNATQSVDVPGWNTDAGITPNGGGGVVPKWADNGDFGPSGTDLQGIIIGTAPKQFSTTTPDPRRTLGIAPYHNSGANPHDDGEYAGSIYVELPGRTPTGALEIEMLGGSTYDANGDLSTIGVTAIGGRVDFQFVPEPSAISLILFTGLVAAGTMRNLATRVHYPRSLAS